MLVADPLDVVRPVAVIEHGRAFERLDRDDPGALRFLQTVSGGERPARTGAGHEGGEREIGVVAAEMGVDRLQGGSGAAVMAEIVGELGKLVEDRVGRIALQLVARVVDFLDVALGARRADDVVGVLDPFAQPVEPLGAHPLGQHRHAAHPHDARDRDPAPAVIASGRPDRLVARRIEAAGDQPRDEAGIGGEHLVRADHREAVAERDGDRRIDPGQRSGQNDMRRHGPDAASCDIVEPVNAEQVGGVGRVAVDLHGPGGDIARDRGRIGELLEGRQDDARLAQMTNRAVVDRPVLDPGGKTGAMANCRHAPSRRGRC